MEAGWHWGDWAGMAALGAAPAGVLPATGIYMAATTMTLTGIVMAQVGNGFAMRTHRQSILKVGFFTNKLRWWGLGAELLGIAALMYVPVLQRVFSTAPLTWHEWTVLAMFAPLLLIYALLIEEQLSLREIFSRNGWPRVRRVLIETAPALALAIGLFFFFEEFSRLLPSDF